MVFGISVIYALVLIFILFQNYQTLKSILYWFYPELQHFRIDSEKVNLLALPFSLGANIRLVILFLCCFAASYLIAHSNMQSIVALLRLNASGITWMFLHWRTF